MDLRFTGPDDAAYETAHVILVSQQPVQPLHGMTGHGTRERLDLFGVFGDRIAGEDIEERRRIRARFIALEAAGRPHRFPGLLEWTAPQFRVDSDIDHRGRPGRRGAHARASADLCEQAPGVADTRTASGGRSVAHGALVHLLSHNTAVQLRDWRLVPISHEAVSPT